MKNTFYLILLSSLFIGCSSSDDEANTSPNVVKVAPEDLIDTYEERVGEIEKYNSMMLNDSLTFDPKIAKDLIKAYEGFIDSEYNFKSEAKEYMFKTGELYMALNKPHEAIKYFNMLLDRDPGYKLAPAALFYKASTIGDMLKEHDEAKKLYQEFIDTYPDHELLESAKASISIEGKDLNELIKEFEKKNQSAS